MIVYLANPYGFSEQQRNRLLPELVKKIESLGHEVWEPFARNNQNIDFSDPDWPYYIGRKNKIDVRKCDAIFAVVNGDPPDEGVMVELGLAIAWKKNIYLFRDDFRECGGTEKYPLNLMIFCGLPKDGWQKYFFTSVENINF